MSASPLCLGFLEEVIPSEEKHYVWLRSLSYLEYIGYRKMVKALRYEKVNRGVYHHLTDEIQHSFMLRELADKKLGGLKSEPNFGTEHQEMAENYFQDIDSFVEDWLQRMIQAKNPFLCYLLVSYVVEKRAMQVYPQYFHQLGERAFKYTIQKIIQDEAEHLSYLEGKLREFPALGEANLTELFDFEEGRFVEFLRDLQGTFQQDGLN